MISKGSHSLEADLATGWRPRLKIIGPMPLSFDNSQVDRILRPIITSDTTLDQVIYLGPRPRDTLEIHSMLAHNYQYKYRHLLSADYDHLKPFFKKFYSQFQPEFQRPYCGMNKKEKSSIIFDSNFESGNLDCVVRRRKNQFDLFLRIDSNTKGHILWFYFKVSNTQKDSHTVRINIVNLRTDKIFIDNVTKFLKQCFKPYLRRKNGQWSQGGNNIRITDERISLSRATSFFYEEDVQETKFFRKLSFDLELSPLDQVQVAYSIPYTYSQLLEDVKMYRTIANSIPQTSLSVEFKNQSLSGLDIPYLKITDSEEQGNEEKKQKKKKYCIFILGRQHPGEANGSHVLNGFLKELLSDREDMKQLRKYCDFHVIPMLNPDGVVMGNFRTSLYGKDLNRLFKKNQTMMIPEVEFSRTLAYNLAKVYKKRMLMFLDFHGHSTRKNAFCYAPSFFQTNGLQDIRQFPKIIAENTQIFRYPSCSFRIANQKKTTARALLSKLITLCFTIQTSNWSYIQKADRNQIAFTKNKWEKFGTDLTKSLCIYVNLIYERKLQRKKKMNDKEDKKQMKTFKVIPASMPKSSKKKKKLKTESKQDDQKNVKRQDKSLIRSSKNSNIEEIEKNVEQKNQAGGGEDSDGSEQQNMEDDKFKKYISDANKMIVEFQKVYYGEAYKGKQIVQNKSKKRATIKPMISQQACLRNPQSETKILHKSSNTSRSIKKFYQEKNLDFLQENGDQKRSKIMMLKQLQKQPRRQNKVFPQISIINYLAMEGGKDEDEKPLLKIPKINNLHIRSPSKRS